MALPLFSGSIPQIQSPLSGIAESTMPGIQTGLQMLAQHKLGQMQQQQQSQRLAPIAKQYGLGGAEVLGEQGLMQLIKQQQQQQQRSQLAALLSGGQSQQSGQAQDQFGQQLPQQAQQSPAAAPGEKDFNAERQKIAALAAYDPNLYQREKARIDRSEQAYLKRGQEQTKTLMPIVSEANQNIRASENKIKDLGLLKHMIEQGKWQTNKFQDIAEKFGLGTIGLSPDSELARQVGAGLALQDVKLMKGSLSDREGAWLRSMYPSLMQTAEGAKKLANKLISDQKAEKLIEEEKLKLIKKNRNIDPLSIETEAFANTQKQRDTIARDMLKDLGYLVQWKDDETGKTIYLPIGETPKD